MDDQLPLILRPYHYLEDSRIPELRAEVSAIMFKLPHSARKRACGEASVPFDKATGEAHWDNLGVAALCRLWLALGGPDRERIEAMLEGEREHVRRCLESITIDAAATWAIPGRTS